MSAWQTPEALVFIRENFSAGRTDKWIADQLGVTKGMVVSKRTRLMGQRTGCAERVETAHRSMQPRPKMSEFHQGAAPKWRSPEGDAVFKAAWDGNVRNADIEEFFNVDRNTLRVHRISLKFTPRGEALKQICVNGWKTPEGDAEFTRQWMAHVHADLIQAHFAISNTALKTRRAFLDLPLRTGAEVARRPNKTRECVEARMPGRPPKPIGAPKIKAVESKPTMASGRHASSIGTRYLGILDHLPAPPVRAKGACCWPLVCDEPSVGRWCVGHSGLLKRAA